MFKLEAFYLRSAVLQLLASMERANRFSTECDTVSTEHDKKSSVLTNKYITMINTVSIRAKNTKLYHVSNVQTKTTNTLPHVPLFLFAII